jgi:hypothetical protein
MIWKNIARRIGVAILLLENANTKGITTSDKSSYYRSALIILSTVVEGLSYELVKKETLAIVQTMTLLRAKPIFMTYPLIL